MPTFLHTDRLLSFTSPLGADKLLLESFKGTEGISELFDFDVLVLALPKTQVRAADLIGKRVTVELQVDATGGKRTFNGMVATLRNFGGDSDFNAYRLRIVPSLWLLTLNTQTRVFQGKNVIEIVKEVLGPYSITPEDDTSAAWPALDYCTQYRETDLQFISRIMEQFGVFYYFTHTTADHTMVLENHSLSLAPCPINDSFPLATDGESLAAFQMVVETFTSATTLVTGLHSYWDHSFMRNTATASSPASSATQAGLGENSHLVYDFSDSAAAYQKSDASDATLESVQTGLQGVERERADAGSVIATGRSNAGTMHSGCTFNLTNHPDPDTNTKYVVVRVEHRASQSPSFRTVNATVQAEPYKNLFTAQPSKVKYRSPKVTPRPRVHGCVTGKVVTPSGDESYLDKYGRVCVQFWWDRDRKPHTTDNTLLRVSQQWASNGFGSYYWPRTGDEVLIDFIEGDPDAPIVVGCVYNGTSMPKYDPASQYTRSGVVTRSSKAGDANNANELRFEDLKGSEQIFVNAEKDFDLHVENDNHWQIDNDQHATIKGNRFESVGADHHAKVVGNVVEEIDGDHNLAIQGKQTIAVTGNKGESITGDRLVAVSGNASENVSQALNQKVGMNYSLQVGQSHFNKAGMAYTVDSGQTVYIKGGMTVVIEAGMELCLSAGGGFISIGPSGVIIQGIMVMINSGGAAVPGVPGMPQDPQAPGSPLVPTAPKWPGDDPRSS